MEMAVMKIRLDKYLADMNCGTRSEVKKMILIKIVNSYNGEKIDTSVTSKKEKTMHGIGIKNVKKIVAKYKGTYDMECEDDEVVTTVTMLYK